MKKTEKWRWVVAADILLHLVAIFFFAFLPPNTLNLMEKLVMGLAVAAAIGVISHASARLRLPWEEWSYLAAGFVCVFTLLVYEFRAWGNIPAAVSVPFGLFLFAGAASSFAAHVVDGGIRRRDRRGR